VSKRKESIQSIADAVSDYREGDVPQRTPKIIEQWAAQFPDEAQDAILQEVAHALSHTYISRSDMTEFLRGLVTHEKFCGGDPPAFWKTANILDIQLGGNSQREMLAMFAGFLKQEIGIDLKGCGKDGGPFVYIDDGVFGGGRIANDLAKWIRDDAPEKCEVRIVVAALHTGGEYFAGKRIKEVRQATGKNVELSWWRIHEIENRKYFKDDSDVLWPTEVPNGALAKAYVEYLTEQPPKYALQLRTPGSVGKKKFFSSDEGRILLEQQFLVAGLNIRDMCYNLPETARPLGSTLLKTFGFGATVLTFRNCPNNCPLAFWAGDPWIPLFPRSTNSDAFLKRLLEALRAKRAK